MTPAAEKDIRSALRQLRGCRGRLAMARTAGLSERSTVLLGAAGLLTYEAEARLVKLLALLGAERPVPRRKARLKYPSGDARGVF